MDRHHLKIDCPDGIGGGRNTKVELDGHEITTALRGLDLRIRSDEIVTAELQVMVVEHTAYDGQARVFISEETKELLKRLGWAPPDEGGT